MDNNELLVTQNTIVLASAADLIASTVMAVSGQDMATSIDGNQITQASLCELSLTVLTNGILLRGNKA